MIFQSATAAVKIAISAGRLPIVASYIACALSTLIKLISGDIFKFDGPEIKVVSKPLLFSEFAISYPCLPLDSLEINLTGSIYSLVGPAVTIAFSFYYF